VAAILGNHRLSRFKSGEARASRHDALLPKGPALSRPPWRDRLAVTIDINGAIKCAPSISNHAAGQAAAVLTTAIKPQSPCFGASMSSTLFDGAQRQPRTVSAWATAPAHIRNSLPRPQRGRGAFLAVGAVVGSIIAFVSLFSYASLPALALIYIATRPQLGSPAHQFPDRLKLPSASPSAFSAPFERASCFASIVSLSICAAWIVTGLYIRFVLGGLAAPIVRVIATLLAAAVVVAIVVLPVPAGGEDASKVNRWACSRCWIRKISRSLACGAVRMMS
jgi:hypothetical protein